MGNGNRIGFVVDSFLNEGGELFEGGAERHLYQMTSATAFS